MSALRATVRSGRLVLDQTTTFPEGTAFDLVLDPGDDAPEDPELERALAEGLEDLRVGDVVSEEEFLRGLAATP
jgi:hypothetical protein